MLFTPEELGWLAGFTASLTNLVPSKRWTALLTDLVMITGGPELPGNCHCHQDWQLSGGIHQDHAEYNRRIRAAIISFGAREGMYKAAYRDRKRPPPPPGEEDYKKIIGDEYSLMVLDFLRAEPKMPWFREQYKPDQMYQGDALKNQASNPGLSN